MNPQTTRTILIGMVLGVVLGGVAGYFVPDVMISISVIGRLFLNALQILLLPLIVSTIIVGVTGLGSPQKLGRATISALYYFVGTTLIAVVIGLVLAFVMNPGRGVSTAGSFIPDMVTRARATTFTDIFGAYIPANLIESITSGQYLGLVVFTLFFAGVLMVVGRKAGLILDFFRVVGDATQRLVELVLFVSPFGLFALVGSAVARNPESIGSVVGSLSWLTLTFAIALLLQGALVLPLILRFLGHQSIGSYLANCAPALMTALGTASSAATLPVTYSAVVDVNKVDSRAGALVLPLGAMMNFNGGAIYLTVASVFVAQMFGLQFGLIDIFNVAVLSVLLSLGTSGIPGSGPFSLAILFSVVGYPVEAYGAIGLLVLVDWLFDRGRAVLNVWGDAVGAAVVGETFEFKTARVTPDHSDPRDSRHDRGPADRSQRGRRDTGRSATGRTSSSERPSRDTSRDTSRDSKTRERKPRERTRPQTGDQRGSTDRSRPDNDRGRGRGRQPRAADNRTESNEPPKQREPLKPPPLPHEKAAEQSRPQQPERTRPPRPERPERTERPERPERTPRWERPEKPSEPTPREQIADERALLAAEVATFRQESELRQAEDIELVDETTTDVDEPEMTDEETTPVREERPRERRPRRDRDSRPDRRRSRRSERPSSAESETEEATETESADETVDTPPARFERSESAPIRLREIPDRPKERPVVEEPVSEPTPVEPVEEQPEPVSRPEPTWKREPERPSEPVVEHVAEPEPTSKPEEPPAREPYRREPEPELDSEPSPVESEPEPESRAPHEDSAAPEPPTPAPVHYGRSKHRRGPAPSSGGSDSTGESRPEPREDVSPLDSVPPEKVTYGRSRRKRTR